MIRKLGAYLSAIIVAYLLAAVQATQSVVARLGEIGIDVDLKERLGMTLHDIAGMAGIDPVKRQESWCRRGVYGPQ